MLNDRVNERVNESIKNNVIRIIRLTHCTHAGIPYILSEFTPHLNASTFQSVSDTVLITRPVC